MMPVAKKNPHLTFYFFPFTISIVMYGNFLIIFKNVSFLNIHFVLLKQCASVSKTVLLGPFLVIAN